MIDMSHVELQLNLVSIERPFSLEHYGTGLVSMGTFSKEVKKYSQKVHHTVLLWEHFALWFHQSGLVGFPKEKARVHKQMQPILHLQITVFVPEEKFKRAQKQLKIYNLMSTRLLTNPATKTHIKLQYNLILCQFSTQWMSSKNGLLMRRASPADK